MTDVTTTDFSCFNVTIEDGVAHIQLKRPEAMNSMSRAFWNELPVIVKDIDHNARARCIVISSTGKHFSAGMDLAVFGGGGSTSANQVADRHINAEQQRHHILWLQDCFGCLDDARIPVIVAIQGGCIGGAVDMTSACDIRYATEDAFFCIQEINIGMVADVGTLQRLPKLIPLAVVKELAYTGRRLAAGPVGVVDRGAVAAAVRLCLDAGDGEQQGDGPKVHGVGSGRGGLGRGGLAWIFIIARSISPANSRSSAASDCSMDLSIASRCSAEGLRST